MFNYTARDMLYFYVSCFEQRRYPCGQTSTWQAVCLGDWRVSDTTNRGWRIQELTIPSAVPNGVYVLAWIWYGSIDWETRSHDRFETTISASSSAFVAAWERTLTSWSSA